EDRDLLALGDVAHREAVRADRAPGTLGVDHLRQVAIGNPVTDLDRHESLLVMFARASRRAPQYPTSPFEIPASAATGEPGRAQPVPSPHETHRRRYQQHAEAGSLDQHGDS